MRTSTTIILTSAAFMLALTGCSSDMQRQEVPSATSTPSASASAPPGDVEATEAATEAPAGPAEETATENENEFGIDVSAVDLSEIEAAYGADLAATVLPETMTTISVAYNEISALHGAREGDDAQHYEIVRERLTETAFEALTTSAASDDQQEQWDADALVPVVGQDGKALTYEGIDYFIDPEGELFWSMVSEPYVEISPGATPDEEHVAVSVDLRLDAQFTEGRSVTMTRALTVLMTPTADGVWLVDGWYMDTTEAPVITGGE